MGILNEIDEGCLQIFCSCVRALTDVG